MRTSCCYQYRLPSSSQHRSRGVNLISHFGGRLSHSKGVGPMVIRVLLADDHSIVREGLRVFLGYDPELAVVGEAADGAEAVQLARQLHPDVVLMDLLLPVMDGIAATAAIRRELPETEVIALTSAL